MRKVLKKGLCLIVIYTVATTLIFLMSERITKLDRGVSTDLRNTNGSVSILEK